VNQNAVILKDAKVAQIREVKLRLLSPEPNRYFITREGRQPVNFSWEPTGDAGDVYFELSRERGFATVVTRRRVKGESVSESVGEGEYFWRLKSSEGAGGKPEYSDTRKINIIADRPVNLVYPGNNAVIDYVTRPPMINFRWGKNDIASSYTLEIAGDQAFSKKISSVTTGLTGLAVDTLPAGTYFWRVSTRAGLGDPSYSGTSDVHRLVVNRKQVVDKTELISPPEGAVFSGYQAGNRGIIYSWKLVNQVGKYELLIARDGGFKNVIHRETVTGNFSNLVRDYEAGAYFWKVKPVAGEAEGAAFTPARSFSILGGEGIRLLSPVDNFETQPARDQADMEVNFAWTKSPIEGRYLFELSRDAGFTQMARRETLSKDGLKIPAVTPGTYYWRVTVLDSDDAVMFKSGVQSIRVREAEMTPRKGIVVISSSAERGAVYVNGTLAGYGKVTVNPDPGTVKVRITAEGFNPYERDIVVKAGERQEVLAELRKIPERPVVIVQSSQPRGAVYINGKLAGYGTVTVNPDPGTVQVAVTAPGFLKFERDIVAKAGERQEIRAELQRIPERPIVVVYSSQPRGAVYINGKLSGYGTVTARPDPGTVRIAVVAPGYRRFEKDLAVRAGEKQELRAELELLERQPVAKTDTEVPVTVKLKSATGVPIIAKPLVRNDVIVTATAGGTISGASKSGGPGWTANLKSRIESTPVGDETGIYVVTTRGELVKIDGRNGRVKWKKNVDGPILFSSRPLIAEGKIIVATSFGNVSAFTPEGRQVWKKKLGGGVFSSPAYHDGVVYVGTENRTLHAIQARDGAEIWKYSTDSRMVASTPLVHRGFVYAGCYSGSFYAVNARTGSIGWHFKAERPILTSPIALDKTVYTGSLDGRLYALNSDSGRLRWKYDAGQKIMIDPVSSNGKIYLASEKTFQVVDASNGSLIWKVDFNSNIKTPPSPLGDDVIFGLANGEVVSLNPSQKQVNR